MFTWFTRSRDWYVSQPPLSFEAITLGALLMAGLLVMPALIYLVGTLILRAYQNGGLLTFYLDFLKGLAGLRPSCWVVLAGPFAFVTLLRVFRLILRKL